MNDGALELVNAYEAGQDTSAALQKFVTSTCNRPKRIPFVNRFYSTCETMYQPCGQCDQCRNTHANQMLTRMYLDAFTLKHIYFVTLTYKSYDRRKDIPRNLRSACWHRDNYNIDHRVCYSPCLLDYGHLQKFYALLRTNLKKKYGRSVILESFSAGEYGSKHGRPHFHLILVCDVELSKDDILGAWSWHGKPYHDPDKLNNWFEDLFANGTMDGKNQLSSKRCFKYVFKYSGKSSYDESLYDKTRLEMGIKYLLNYAEKIEEQEKGKITISEDCKRVIRTKVHHSGYVRGWCYEPSRYQRERLERTRQREHDFTYTRKQLLGWYRPFSCCSTGHALGKYWFEANRPTILGGNKRLPEPIQVKFSQASRDCQSVNKWSLSWPPYYEHLLQKEREPFVSVSRSLSDLTSTKKVTTEDMLTLHEALSPLCGGVRIYYVPPSIPKGSGIMCEHLEPFHCDPNWEPVITKYFGLTPQDGVFHILPMTGRKMYVNRDYFHQLHAHVYDYSTGCKLVPYMSRTEDDVYKLDFLRMKWSRARRQYEYHSFLSGADFLRILREGLDANRKEFDKLERDREISRKAHELVYGDAKRTGPLTKDWKQAVKQNELAWKTFRKEKHEHDINKNYVYD